MPFQVRPMHRSELDVALKWAREEGWNPGVADADAFYAMDPTGFFVGELDGEMVSCVSVVKSGDDRAFVGLFIVRPEFRGKGFGKATWNAALATSAGRAIGLDGVVAQQPTYARWGFVCHHRNVRYAGRPSDLPLSQHVQRAVAVSDVNELVAYDTAIFGIVRDAFLRHWLDPASPTRITFCWRDAPSAPVRGYGTVRRCADNWRVGPLLADSADVAEALLAALADAVDGASIGIDVPADVDAAVALAVRAGLTPTFETARMYFGRPFAHQHHCVFGITTLELG